MQPYREQSPTPPKLRHTLCDIPRAAIEGKALLLSLPTLRCAATGDGHPVLIIPGFGGGDGSTTALRRWLKSRNFASKTWNCGRNMASTPMRSMADALEFRQEMVAKLQLRVAQLHAEHGRKVSLIGWSLGGLYVDQLAQQHPTLIRQVITLGTPHGDPRGTAPWSIMQRVNRGNALDPNLEMSIKAWQDTNNTTPRVVPTTVIYSPIDGLVSPSTARLPDGAGAAHIQIRASHCGLTINPRIYWLIANRLAQAEGQERAFCTATKPWWL